jgi:Ca-activated chloride channel family protein
MIKLANPFFLLIGIIFLPLLFKGKATFLGYSHLQLLEADRGLGFWQRLPKSLAFLVVALLVFGVARPQWRSVVKQERFLARDILLIMDLSYSMENNFISSETGLQQKEGPRKIDVAKKAAIGFIQKRKNDRIGLLVFGDETFGSWPLTRDVKLISKKVERLGSTFYGGTNLAEPFLKSLAHFTEMGQSENRILVYLSDGEARIPSKTREGIIREMKKMDVNLYLLGIQLKKENNDILEIVNRIGGRFIATESARDLSEAFDEIDRLEPSVVEIEVERESQELYPIFVLVALGLLSILTLLRNTLFVELC